MCLSDRAGVLLPEALEEAQSAGGGRAGDGCGRPGGVGRAGRIEEGPTAVQRRLRRREPRPYRRSWTDLVRAVRSRFAARQGLLRAGTPLTAHIFRFTLFFLLSFQLGMVAHRLVL